jgi:hypothetical protein
MIRRGLATAAVVGTAVALLGAYGATADRPVPVSTTNRDIRLVEPAAPELTQVSDVEAGRTSGPVRMAPRRPAVLALAEVAPRVTASAATPSLRGDLQEAPTFVEPMPEIVRAPLPSTYAGNVHGTLPFADELGAGGRGPVVVIGGGIGGNCGPSAAVLRFR